MAEPAPSRRYTYPRRTRWSWGGAFLVSLAVCGAAIALQFSARVDLVQRGQLLIFTAVFAALAGHALAALRVLRGAVELSPAGVVNGGVLVPWERVRAVDIQPLARRMDAYDDAGVRVLRIRPELEAFAGVQQYIIEHMNPRVAVPPTEVALLSPAGGAVPLAALALIAVWFGPRQSGVPALLFAGIAAVLLLLQLARRRSLLLERDALVLRQGWRSVRVPYAGIEAVRVMTDAGGRTRVVMLERRDADAVAIAGFRGGYRAAAATITAAWQSGRQR